MASTHPHYENKDDPTGEAVELDHVDPAAKNIVEEPALLAQENKLSLLQTIRIYPRATVLCAFAAFGAISDGYQYAMPGSIVALKGFIRQFGSPDATGTYKLNPQHVALWGGEFPVLMEYRWRTRLTSSLLHYCVHHRTYSGYLAIR